MDTVSHCSASSMSDSEGKSSAELRKQNKPLMEKRRRARINDSLNKLKSLVLDAMKRDTSRYSKLEKADILEMTVKHLRHVQRQQMAAAMASDTTVISKYRAGFVECASEVTRYLSSIDGLDPAVRSRLMSHLSDCTQKVTTMTAMQEAHTSQHCQQQQQHQHPLMQPMRVQIPQATPISGVPGYSAPSSVSSGYVLTTTSPTSSTTPSPPTARNFHMGVPSGQFALLVPSADGSYALSTAQASLYATGSGNMNNDRAQSVDHRHHHQQRSYESVSSATSPRLTSPMSVTSPTSDRVFRYGSASEVSSSDEEEVEVALDMRVEPCRDVTNTCRDVTNRCRDVTNRCRDVSVNTCHDVNANIIKPGPSQVDYQRAVTSPATSNNHHAPRPEVKVVDDMWRPW